MELDFKGLFGNADTAPQSNATANSGEGDISTLTEPKEENTAPTAAPREQAPTLAVQYQQEKREKERAAAVYKAYQENIRAANGLICEITKGIRGGESIDKLFLKACKAISLMTDDRTFYDVVERDYREVHGIGLLREEALQVEFDATMARKQRLEEAYERETDSGTREHIKWAFKDHIKRLVELDSLMKKAKEEKRGQ